MQATCPELVVDLLGGGHGKERNRFIWIHAAKLMVYNKENCTVVIPLTRLYHTYINFIWKMEFSSDSDTRSDFYGLKHPTDLPVSIIKIETYRLNAF